MIEQAKMTVNRRRLARWPRSFFWLGVWVLTLAGPASWAETVDDIEPLVQQGKIRAALQRLDTLLAEDPENPKARFLKGLALAEDDQYSEAIKVLLNLTVDYPKAPQIYNNLGIIYTRIERYDDAVEMFKKAFRVDPEYDEAYENLGDIYVTMAGFAYAGALVIDPENTALRGKLASLERFAAIVEPNGQRGPALKRGRAPAGGAVPMQGSAAGQSRRPNLRVSPEQSSTPASEVAGESWTDIEKLLLDWAAAWSSGDISAYLAFYDDEFAPADGLTYEKWKQQRRERITPSKIMSIKLEDIAIELQSVDDARATFIQHYHSDSYRDRVDKLLVLKRRGGQWRIVGEVSSPSK
ncbi:MAG: tetratricopeptide repeat protein [Gammaproteobacteria bacterium]|nr:tetratricopeptide repeat protein [Gammaproteobacteria bacterium]